MGAGLDVSHHARISQRGGEMLFFLDILFHRTSAGQGSSDFVHCISIPVLFFLFLHESGDSFALLILAS
jgi:hypothetical protein